LSSKKLIIHNRVYLKRIKLFFGNAVGNLISAIIGGIFISLILNSGNVPVLDISIWFSFIVLFALITAYIEKSYAKEDLTIENGSKLVFKRAIPGSLIALTYGVTPFVFSSYLGVQEEMFLFIALSAMISIAIVGYSTMPYYYLLLNVLTMTPLTFYFFTFSDSIHIILALTAVIWQILVLSKGWMVSKSAIHAIVLNEQLQDEIRHHEQTKEKLHQLATHDILTGVPNRRLLMENLESMFALARRNNKKIIIMFLDLDGFKNINDSFGHESGDYLLKEVASRLKLHIRQSDILARMGGDEFILGFMDSDNIDILATRIIDSISEPVLFPNSYKVQVGVSIGVSVFPKDGNTPEDLIRVSDDRMYKSKANGKNRYTVGDELL